MKTWKLTLIYLIILATLVLGVLVVEVQPAPPRARAKAYFYPRTYTLDSPLPDTWDAWLHFSPPRTAADINASTILLEGSYPCLEEGPYDHPKQPKIVVPFDPHDILEVAILKLYHNGGPLEPGKGYQVFLEVTGLLMDGTPFSTGMSGCIVLFVPDNPFGGPIFP